MRPRMAAIATLLRAEDHRRVAGSPRFRASGRRQLFRAAYTGMSVLVGVGLLDIVALSALDPHHVLPIVASSGALAVTALAGRLVLDRCGPRAAEPVAFVVSLVAIANIIALGLIGHDLVILTVGYLVLAPQAVAVFIPWLAGSHARWLLAYAALTFAYIAAVPGPALSPEERADVAVLAVMSIVLSLAGTVLATRARVRAFSALSHVGSLRHQAEIERRRAVQAIAVIEQVARMDQLTGVGNRRRLHDDLRSERGRIDRAGASCGLLEADIDRFKTINDRMGHGVGDTVLRQVATILVDNGRSGDRVYRWGGEEFLIVLPAADADAAYAAAERLRQAVEDAGLPHPANGPYGCVTISIGGTVISPTGLDETDEVWIGRADRALYAAKSAGRNRVRMELPPDAAA